MIKYIRFLLYLVLTLTLPNLAAAENYIAGFLGYAMPENQSLEADIKNSDNTIPNLVGFVGDFPQIINDGKVEIDDSIVGGGKIGHFFNASVLGGNIGIEAEAYHFGTDINTQPLSVASLEFFTFLPGIDIGLIETNQLNKLNVDVTAIGLNMLYRKPFFKNDVFPKGMLHLYAGLGLGIFIAEPVRRIDSL